MANEQLVKRLQEAKRYTAPELGAGIFRRKGTKACDPAGAEVILVGENLLLAIIKALRS